jgi:hypothetical protein
VRRRTSHIFWTIDSQVAVGLSVLRAGRPLPSGRFLVLIYLSRPEGHSAAGKMRSSEKSNDLIGSRTPDLPACSIVLQRKKVLQARGSSVLSRLQLTLHPSHVKAPKWNPAAGSPHTRHNWFICKQAPAPLVTQSDKGKQWTEREAPPTASGDSRRYTKLFLYLTN